MSEFNYTDAELKAMKNEYAKAASQAQFDLWIAECRNRGLVPVKDVVLQVRATKEWNPETKQKEFVKKAVHITTIQALRKLAERTGKYAGQLPSKWVYLDPVSGMPTIESEVPLPEPGDFRNARRPWAAKASVLRKGFENPIVVPARFEAYAQYFSSEGSQSLNSTWTNRGPEQLEKCAEALALRKAFPEELGGLYLQEELRDEETVAATAQTESTENVQTVNSIPNPPVSTVGPMAVQTVPNPPATVPNSGKIAKPVARKKRESVPDAGKPWGGEFEPKTSTTPGSPVIEPTANIPQASPNIHGVAIEDSEIEFPGDPEPNVDPKPAPPVSPKPEPARLPTDEEAKGFRERLIKVKDKGYAGLGPWILKKSGKPRTQDIPYNEIAQMVNEVEAAEKAGTLKEMLA